MSLKSPQNYRKLSAIIFPSGLTKTYNVDRIASMIEGKLSWDYAREPTVVIGGRGEFGTRAADGLKRGLKIEQVVICDIGDPILELLQKSTIAFFATEELITKDIIESARGMNTFKPRHVILEGASTKGQLIPLLEELDQEGISTASVHLGIKTDNSWAGAKLWTCEVGPNSDRALLLAGDLFSYFRTRIVPIKLREHKQIQETQVHTFVKQLAAAISLRNRGITIQESDKTSTANSQLAGGSDLRGFAQPKRIIAEVLSGQVQSTTEIIDSQIAALQELKGQLGDRETLEAYIEKLQNFHGGLTGELKEMFDNTGLLVAEILRIALYNRQFSTPDDIPGTLKKLLIPFEENEVNLTAIGSMRVPPTKELIQLGMDARLETVVFKIGADEETVTSQKEEAIDQTLREMGCQIKK